MYKTCHLTNEKKAVQKLFNLFRLISSIVKIDANWIVKIDC